MERAREDEMVLDTISEFCRNIKSEQQVSNIDDEEPDRLTRKRNSEIDVDNDEEQDQESDANDFQNGTNVKSEAMSLDKG